MWVTLLRSSSQCDLPRLALAYARVTNAVLRQEQLPDWPRVAVLWPPGGRSGTLRYSDPLDVTGDPLAPALEVSDEVAAHAVIERCAIDVLRRIGADHADVRAVAESWSALTKI